MTFAALRSLGLAVAATILLGIASANAEEFKVTIDNFTFTPAELKVKVGDTVIIAGNPVRTAGEHRMRMVTFKRTSDGLSWGNREGERVD